MGGVGLQEGGVVAPGGGACCASFLVCVRYTHPRVLDTTQPMESGYIAHTSYEFHYRTSYSCDSYECHYLTV